MKDNTDFPIAITKYLSMTNLKDLEGDGFILLVEIFQTASFREVTTEAFINSLFESFSYLQSEAIYLALIHILLSVSYEAEKEKNLVIKFSAEHSNKRLYAEGVLLLLNKGQSAILAKSLKFVVDILEDPSTKDDFFYTNDLKALMDILLREIANISSDEERLLYLNALGAILNTSFYKKEKHRSGEISDLLNDCKFCDDISDDTQNKLEELLASGLI